MKRLLAIMGVLCLPPAAWAAQPQARSVVLRWSAPARSPDPVTGYNVYRAETGSSTFAKLNASPVTTTTYTDDTVQPGTTYTYYVVSVDAQGNQSTPSAYWSWPTRPPRSHGRHFRRRAEKLLLLPMLLGVAGLIAAWVYLARMRRTRTPAAR